MFHSYARISKDPLNIAMSIERQVADNERRATQLGWPTPDHIIERDRSAWRKAGSRPGFNELLRLIRSQETEGVVIWDIDRLLRRMDELEWLIQAVEEFPVMVYSAAGEFDLNDSNGRYTARILVAGAQKASDDTSRRIKRALADAPPRERSFAHQPDNEDIVRWMVTSLIDGATYSWVADTMNEDGLVTIQNNPWSVTTVGRLMRNKKLIDIVGESRFIDLQKACDSRATNKGHTTRSNHTYPLSGLVTCGVCKGTMIGSGIGREHGYQPRYRCRGGTTGKCWNGILAQGLEDQVREMVRKELANSTLTRASITTVDPEIADRIEKLDHAFFIAEVIDADRYNKVNAELVALMEKSMKVTETFLTLEEYDGYTDEQLRVKYPMMLEEVIVKASRAMRGYDRDRVHILARTQR